MPSILVTYGLDSQGMALRIEGQNAREFTRSIPWRAGMFLARSCCQDVTEEAITYPSDLTYKRCLEVVDSLSSGGEYGVSVDLDPSFEAFIASSQTYIEQRSHVGLAIKARNEAVLPEFEQFQEVVNTLMMRPLRDRQMWDAFFMTSVRWSANFSVPGSGKTASVLGEYAFLSDACKVDRIVVVCPKSAFESWRMEWLPRFRDEAIPQGFFLPGPRPTGGRA